MADFPALEPEGRTYEPGEPAVNIAPTRSGTEYRTRVKSAFFGARLRLQFSDRSLAEVALITNHYIAQGGSLFGFQLSPEVVLGYGGEVLAPSTALWHYVTDPEIEPGPGNLQTVTVTLEAWA
jgi:hypothetical protein